MNFFVANTTFLEYHRAKVSPDVLTEYQDKKVESGIANRQSTGRRSQENTP